ncbi:hypothetical protein PG984_005631 [Apiospora sp. TS-2023a]
MAFSNGRYSSNHPVVGDLYSSRITCLDTLWASSDSTAFLAMDTEFVHTEGKPRGSVLLQVGLAYVPGLSLPTQPPYSRPTIKDFVQRNQITGSTVNITLTAENQQLVRSFNNGKIPFRKTTEFWEEQDCGIGELDHRMNSLVRHYKEDASSRGKDLVLVTFAHGAEWRYLTIYFPKIAQYFTSWLDVRQLAKANTHRSNTPPLKTCLTCYGYHWMDITCGSSIVSGEDYEGQERNANADNAGNDACMTLALLECLQDPEFRQRLMKRQAIEAIVHLSETPPLRELFFSAKRNDRRTRQHPPLSRIARKERTEGPAPHGDSRAIYQIYTPGNHRRRTTITPHPGPPYDAIYPPSPHDTTGTTPRHRPPPYPTTTSRTTSNIKPSQAGIQTTIQFRQVDRTLRQKGLRYLKEHTAEDFVQEVKKKIFPEDDEPAPEGNAVAPCDTPPSGKDGLAPEGDAAPPCDTPPHDKPDSEEEAANYIVAVVTPHDTLLSHPVGTKQGPEGTEQAYSVRRNRSAEGDDITYPYDLGGALPTKKKLPVLV